MKRTMVKKSINDLSDLQKLIMELIWKAGEATAREVHEYLSKRKPLAYTTALTMLQRLEKDGWLKHRKEGRAHIYMAAFSREKEALRASKRLIKRVFFGDARLLFQHLIEEVELSDEELSEIRKMIDKKRQENRQ